MTDNSYKIELGIGLNTADFNSLKTKIKSLEDDKIKIKLDIGDADNKIDGIKKSLQDLGKGNTKNTLTINTASLENSLADVKDAILDIRDAFGTLDDKSNMKSFLSSINQIANSIGKVTDETDTLIKSLSVLSKKDFGFNFNLKTGNANPLKAATDYGIEARRKTIPALREQAAYLENLLGGYQQADKALERHLVKTHKASGVSIKHNLTDDMANTGSIAKQMEAIEKYISYLKEIALGKGIKLDGFDTQFSKSAEKIVDDTVKIQTGVKQTEEALEAAGKELKQVFGSGIGAEQLSAELTPIINKLGEIRDAIQNLSKGTSLDGLTQSFDRLSGSIENLLTNAGKVKDVLNTGFSGGTQQVNRKLNNTVGQSAQKPINVDDVIDQQTLRLMEEYGVKGKNAFNEIRQAIVNYKKELIAANNVDFDPDDEFAGFSNANINQVISAITKQKKEVNELKEAYKGLAAYVKEANDSAKKNGTKIYLPDSIRQEYSDDFRSMRSQLGAAFTSDKKYKYSGIDFEGWITELNGRLGGIIDLSKGAEYAFEDLVKKNNFGKGSKYISGDDLFEQHYLSRSKMAKDIESSLDIIENAEQELAQVSTQTTNTIVQNNERQQQSHKETELAKKLAEKEKNLAKTTQELEAEEKRAYDIVESGKDPSADITALTNQYQDCVAKINDLTKEKNNLLTEIQQINDALERERQQAKEAANANAQLTASIDNADDVVDGMNRALNNLGVNFTGADDVTRDIQEMGIEIQKVTTKINGNNLEMSITGIQKTADGLERVITETKRYEDVVKNTENINKTFRQSFETSADAAKKLEKETKDSFNTLKSLAKEMGDIDVKLTGLDTTEDIDEINSLKRVLDGLEDEYRQLHDATRENLSADQVKELDQIFANTSNAVREFKNELKSASEAQELISDFNKLKSLAKEIATLKIDILKSDDANEIVDLTTKLDRLEKEYNDILVKTNGKLSFSQLEDLKIIAKNGEEAFDKMAKKIAEVRTELAQGIKVDLEVGKYDNQMSQMYEKFDRLSGAGTDLRNSITTVENAYEELNKAIASGDEDRIIQAQKEYAKALEITNNQLRIQAREEAKDNRNQKLEDDRNLFRADIDNYMAKYSAAIDKYGDKLLKLKAAAESCDRVELNHLQSEFKQLDREIDKAGLKMESLGDRIKNKFKEYSAYFSVAEVFMYVEQGLREMFNTVLEIDTAMTGLYRVTDLTSTQYDALFNNMISSAKEYGATLNDIINATTDWVRAGFSADTALGMAEITTMYQHISDLDYDTAAENLLTAYNGFKSELNNLYSGDEVAAVEYIADIFNELDKRNCP